MKNLLIQRDFELLQRETKTLETKIQELKSKLGEAAAHGGAFVCKIPEYDSLTTQIDLIENRIRSYKEFLKESEIVKPEKLSADTIGPYCLVTAEDENGEVQKYYLIYPFIPCKNPKVIPVSPNSPVGKALVGEKKDSIVKISLPKGGRILKVLDSEMKIFELF